MTSLPSGSALPGVGTIGSIRGTLQARHPDLSTYRAYTTAFDREIFAEQLCSREELAQLRTQMDTELARIQAPWIRLARRLQRRLLAQRKWAWAFDLESGLIDAAKLPRTVVDPRDPLCFKQEYPVSVSDTVVSLLIDCSGSMRGEPMLIAAASADLLARALERCGVKVEVLGFTTHGWRGGSVFRRWVADGRPSYPGRLAELRHIIFKAAAVPWRRARSPIAAMLRHDLLYENVDGEALLWAHRRLLTRPEQRRILIVVSDGAPAEDATTSTNSADYLARHLYDVTNWIEKNRAVELLAIGIRYSVKDFYRRSVQIQNTDELGSVLIEQLALRLT